MIQRIQTLWLVLAALLMAAGFIFPVAQYTMVDEPLNQTISGELNLLPNKNPEMWNQKLSGETQIEFSQADSDFKTWPLIALAAVTILIAIVSIFLFRNRVRQSRIVLAGFMVNLIYVFLVFFWAVDGFGNCMKAMMNIDQFKVVWSIGAYTPIASLLLLFLAQRAIRKDEALVRAADRLR